ncbi:MAG: hypothetical protein QXP80_04280 [Zestosphaera sp.]
MTGTLIKCASGVYKGSPFRLTYVMPGVIGGYGRPRHLQLILTVDEVLSSPFLSILLKGEDLKPRSLSWKVSVNSVNVTREFKPQVIVNLEGLTYASQVFDVSQIAREPGKYLVRLSTESSRIVEILSVSLVGVSPSVDAEVALRHYSGVLILSRGESYSLEHPEEGLELGVEGVIEMPSRGTEFIIKCGNEHVLTQLVGVNEVSLRGFTASPEGHCTLVHRGGDVTKPVVVSDLILYRPLTSGPQIHVEASLINAKEIQLTVRNEGGASLRRGLVVILREGRIVARSELNDLCPGDVKMLKLLSSEDLRGREVYVRVVYHDVWGQNVKTFKLRT